MKHTFIPLGAFTLFATLLACAPINEDQCRAGNWHTIGLRDGANGRSENFIAALADECAKYNVPVDQVAWKNGRIHGLKSYCTIENAERIGRKGREIKPVCGPNIQLISANDHGEKYFRINEELEELQAERDDLKAIINSNFQGELTREQKTLLRRYLRRLNNVDDDIYDIKRAIRRYPSYSSTL